MARRRRPKLGGGWTLWPHALVRGAGFPFARLDEVFRANDVSAALREVAREPRFREAVLWQNRAAVVDGLDSLLRKPVGASDSRTRKKELVVARYLQRYCAKNDTIGFFGPVGWATVGAVGEFGAGPELLSARATFFEPWAVRALAEAVVQAPPFTPSPSKGAEDAGIARAAPGPIETTVRPELVEGLRQTRWRASTGSARADLARGSLQVTTAMTSAPDRAQGERWLEAGEHRHDSSSPGGAPALRRWAPLSLPAELRLERTKLVAPTSEYPLSGDEARLLAACEGATPAELVIRRLADGRRDSERWWSLLEKLERDGAVRWEFPVAIAHDPAAPWRAALGRVRDAAARAALTEPLQELDRAKAAVAESAGEPERLEPALRSLEETFERLTGAAAKRHEGRTYGGRGLVYEECRRDVTLTLGPEAIARVAPALHTLLPVARWYSFEIARRLARRLRQVFERTRGPRRRVPLPEFWRATSSLFEHETPPVIAQAAKALRTRWNRVWADAEAREDGVHLELDVAAARVAKLFEAPCPGWPGARHHAPDLMWDASYRAHQRRGEGTPILAELHPGVTPFTTLSTLAHCPVRRELEAEWRADFPAPLVSPIPWEDFARSSQDARLAKAHWHLDVGGPFASERPARQVLRAADFDVQAKGARLVARHRDGGPELDLLEVFERRIKLRAAVAFSLGDGAARGSRRWLGPLVVQRAHWRFEAEELAFLQEQAARQERVTAWRARNGLPERLFVRSPDEVKPLYLDCASPLSVELLARLARSSPWLAFSEMLPGPSGLWLADAEGRRYVSELRTIAVDPQPFDAEAIWGT